MVGGPSEPVWGTFSEARPRPWGFSHAVVPGRACSPGSPVPQPWASGTVLLCWASGFSAFTLRVNLFTRIHREARLDIAGGGRVVGGGSCREDRLVVLVWSHFSPQHLPLFALHLLEFGLNKASAPGQR